MKNLLKKKKLLKFLKPNIRISENLAIIGSSKSVLKKELGEKIDTYQEVIRFNKSPVESYEKFIGSKTTIRVVNNTIFEGNLTGSNKDIKNINFIQLENIKIITISPYKIENEKKKNIFFSSNQYFFLEGNFFKFMCIFYFSYRINIFKDLLRLVLKRKNPSVGLTTILLCVVSGIKPTLFGFDVNEDMSSRSHYWEPPETKKPNKWHDLNIEHAILKKLSLNNLIKIM
jgi:hypothetical protein